MDFFQNTINWIKGELFEASLILSFGLVTVLAAFLFWKFGTTPNAKALFFPLLICGLVYTTIGSGMRISNPKRMTKYQHEYKVNRAAFIQAEKKRVEDFQYGYTISKIVASLFFPMTVLIFWLTKNPTWQGIGIGLAYFALSGLVIDYFSQERADIYYKAIRQALS
ncbi:hypothetical protein J2Y45_003094 [Dyadobacter sp. BE34]|uniref:DUF3169 family protein n=1 Tax=Dyadobacter fermentans TaxID=94254 RepID=A0ABU1QTV5_9BACT|nr:MULTISPECIES: hypothetical protein [Dyadobacter]MDR6804598.1 hypothetical protein [Dyadobacter fermentans]MDR7043643.1 hypothetical protein [Dyadobacter sp. BE242]MDR7197955.1 hypothetical protein [Dyadobacter sp. BE34]MDR7214612.1 hypothetical protein [Dyadobacter sp. BE31]MDR7262147.1 hypothetical protein [Dyadobacter sp. BE32]